MKDEDIKKEIKLGLLENGIDFLLSALDYIERTKSKTDLKYAVLHLCAGTELVLKERLRKEHWSLLFENINKASIPDFESGNFTSVSFKTCIDRLEGICNIPFSDNDKRSFFNLRDKRNRLEHFGIVDSVEALKVASAKVLSTLLSFISHQLSPDDLSPTESKLLRKLRGKLSIFTEFVEKRLKNINRDIKKAKEGSIVVHCPACYQESFVLGVRPPCLFCGYSAGPEVAAREWIESILGLTYESMIKEGGDFPLFACPECGKETVVDIGLRGNQIEHFQYVCFYCCQGWERSNMNECMRCGNLYITRDDDYDICKDCIERQMSKE